MFGPWINVTDEDDATVGASIKPGSMDLTPTAGQEIRIHLKKSLHHYPQIPRPLENEEECVVVIKPKESE